MSSSPLLVRLHHPACRMRISLCGAAVSVSIVMDPHTSVICALFHDTSDVRRKSAAGLAGQCSRNRMYLQGKRVAHRIARNMLASFLALFSQSISSIGHNLSDYMHFQYRLVDVVRQCITPMLYTSTCWGVGRLRGVTLT